MGGEGRGVKGNERVGGVMGKEGTGMERWRGEGGVGKGGKGKGGGKGREG